MSRFKHLTIISVLFILAAGLLLPVEWSAKGAPVPQLLSTYPKNGQGMVANDTRIELTFNQEVNDIDKDKVFVYVKQYGGMDPVEIKQISPGPDNKVFITPAAQLLGGKEYVVSVLPNAVVFKDGPSTFSRHIYFTFKTDYMSFYEVMVSNSSKLTNLLSDYLPRDIIVSAPQRYIEEINILNKQRGKTGTNASQAVTGSATNIDVVTKSANVATVRVDIYEGSRLLHKVYAKPVKADSTKGKSAETKLFSMGFNKLPKQFDAAVLTFDADGNRIDSKIVRASTDENVFQSISEKYKYKTAGNSYSLYELLEDNKLFDTLLEENEIKKLMIQVRR
ncbi:Ig-like domain-containing protein [Bacillus infantis]|uniref:Ig-like domain-containing protein n=1 Tax=Bacillus infantis TaxID=324767 RepID=UPI003CF2ED47